MDDFAEISLPTHLRIAGQDYEVFAEEEWMEGQLGGCNHRKPSLWVADSLAPPRQRQVLIHEILEALNFELDIDLEHHQIELLETGLFGLLRDNPQLYTEEV